MELVKNGASLVDVRSAEEFGAGTLEDAVNVPLDKFEAWLEGQSKDTVIVVFCASGIRSQNAVEMAKALGYSMIYNLGGMDSLIK